MKALSTKSLAFGIALLGSSAVPAMAQDYTPNFGTTVGTAAWYTDRYQPTTFALSNNTYGRNDVLNIGITSATNAANRGGQSATFYNTQGMQSTIDAPNGSYSLKADLYVDGSWATNANGGNRRTDMWGVAYDATNSPWDYPIIGFTNADDGTGKFRGYDVNTGAWLNFAAPVNYDAWNSLELNWDSGTNLYSYLVNGVLAGTVNGDGIAVNLHSVIMQAYNFNDPTLGLGLENTDYTALWSNEVTTPEPASMVLLATGLVGVAAAARRRRKA